MEVIRNALLPRRITQIYTDTKRLYEEIVQITVTNPQVSSLHLKLRIQKDRLVAWGIEWADSNARHDIDDSLDRAGISDLVASIMSSIRQLLDDAEKLQPSLPLSGRMPDQKGGFLSMPNREWTNDDLNYLQDLVKDITMSIDTLCDLSKSTQAIRNDSEHARKPEQTKADLKENFADLYNENTPFQQDKKDRSSISSISDLIRSMRIEPRRLQYPQIAALPTSQPPAYDLVTASPEHRHYAFLKDIETDDKKHQQVKRPVLVDFAHELDYNPDSSGVPSLRRYEELVLALQASDEADDDFYTGCLRIIGWIVDPLRSKFGFVYDIPIPNLRLSSPFINSHPPATLLSFLQHSGNTDTDNLPSLEDRYRLALNLITNLLHIHAKGLTHRHINSNNIVFVEGSGPGLDGKKPWKEGIIRKPYIVSWDHCADDHTCTPEDLHVARLYRHPDWKIGARSSYKPSYDVYSLGLVLLEIGLWMPLHKLWKPKYTLPIFRKKLQNIYANKLVGKCGTLYKNVVQYCLKAADNNVSGLTSSRISQDFHQMQRQEGFYWSALKPIEKCCLIDESSNPTIQSFPSTNAAVSDLRSTIGSQRTLVNDRDYQPLTVSGVVHDSPKEKLEADSLVEKGTTQDILVWSYQLPPHLQTYYKTVMLPKIGRMLARAISRWEGYTIMTFMAGETAQSAKPTIYMTCLSINRAWKILDYVNRDKRYFDIKVASGQMEWSKGNKKRGRRSGTKSIGAPPIRTIVDHESQHTVSKYQRKPCCGASIGAFIDERHLDRVTFGGIVLADGEPFGMSVHHMLEDQDVDHGLDYTLTHEQVRTGNADRQDLPDLTPDVMSDDDDFDPSILDQDFSDEDEECYNMGDTLGTQPGQGRDQIVTQPALDDVDPAFFPNEDDMSDEHLLSHGLGYVHASSGMKQIRLEAKADSHEVDWSLFKVCEGRLETRNRVEGSDAFWKASTEGPISHPSSLIRADELGDRAVHAIGATSGLAEGRILPQMVDQKMPGRVFPSTVWMFKGGFGVGGDSGAWIIDNTTGAVCGHVIAWNERQCAGILAPMEAMFHDMERVLGKVIALPTTNSVSAPSYRQQLITGSGIEEVAEGMEELSMNTLDRADTIRAATVPRVVRRPVSRSSQKAHHLLQTLSIKSSASDCASASESDVHDFIDSIDDDDDNDTLSTTPPSSVSPLMSHSSQPALNTSRSHRSVSNTGSSTASLRTQETTERWTQQQHRSRSSQRLPQHLLLDGTGDSSAQTGRARGPSFTIPRKPVQHASRKDGAMKLRE